MSDHTHVVNNGKRDLTLDELARQQPGMDRLMAEVGPRVHRMYYAVKAGNWPLAAYFCKSVIKQLKLSVESRPKYDPEMTDYLRDDYGPVSEAIRTQDAAAFEAAYAHMVRRANDLHGVFGKPYLVWKTPEQPPDDLDLTAGVS
ncbi:MAG: hypothetical protein LC789_12095 [Actinobacteria bacterium]|nr:hypothetical protein [Actinomycetota bacterium]MCA1721256.1 hypothetical protein [Actinomycetota bacterium]